MIMLERKYAFRENKVNFRLLSKNLKHAFLDAEIHFLD